MNTDYEIPIILERKKEQKRFKEVLQLTLQQISVVNPEIKNKIKETINNMNIDEYFYFDGYNYPKVLINFTKINSFFNY